MFDFEPPQVDGQDRVLADVSFQEDGVRGEGASLSLSEALSPMSTDRLMEVLTLTGLTSTDTGQKMAQLVQSGSDPAYGLLLYMMTSDFDLKQIPDRSAAAHAFQLVLGLSHTGLVLMHNLEVSCAL